MDPRVKSVWDTLSGIAPELQDLIAGSDGEFGDLISVDLPPASIEMPGQGAPLTAAERQASETAVLLEKMGIAEIDGLPDPPNWLRARGICSESVTSNDKIAETVLAIAKMAAHDPDVATQLTRMSQPGSALSPLASKFARRLAEMEEESDHPNPLVTNFLKSCASGDQKGMRAVARELIREV
jgi:hypothetical protein